MEEQEVWRMMRVDGGGRFVRGERQTPTNLYSIDPSMFAHPRRIRICTMEVVP